MARPNALTKADTESFETKRRQWVQTLTPALRKWCDDNGYIPRSKLATELEIPASKWKHLISGVSISGDVTIYARLHLRTWLREADPRTVPSRLRYAARVGHYFEAKRAWTDQEYDKWQRTYRLPPRLVESQKETLISETRQLGERQTVGAVIDSFLDGLVRALADQVAEKIMESLESRRESNNPVDIGTLADQLYEALADFLPQTPEDRDRLIHTHGKNHLARLYSLLRDFSQPREERETVLKLNYPKGRE